MTCVWLWNVLKQTNTHVDRRKRSHVNTANLLLFWLLAKSGMKGKLLMNAVILLPTKLGTVAAVKLFTGWFCFSKPPKAEFNGKPLRSGLFTLLLPNVQFTWAPKMFPPVWLDGFGQQRSTILSHLDKCWRVCRNWSHLGLNSSGGTKPELEQGDLMVNIRPTALKGGGAASLEPLNQRRPFSRPRLWI